MSDGGPAKSGGGPAIFRRNVLNKRGLIFVPPLLLLPSAFRLPQFRCPASRKQVKQLSGLGWVRHREVGFAVGATRKECSRTGRQRRTITSSRGMFSLGAVIRSAQCDFIAAKSDFFPGRVEAREAEAIEVREALSWLKKFAFHYVILDMDSLQVFNALHDKTSYPNGFGSIIDDCRALVRSLREVAFSFVRRSANSAAFTVAQVGSSMSDSGEWRPSRKYKPLLFSSINSSSRASYGTFVSEAVRLLGPPASFDASKLKVVFLGEGMNDYSRILPRTYILSHCDFTANLTLTISNVINLEQLRGWYIKDDVVAEWKKVRDDMCLHVHCYVSGPSLLRDLAAEFRYHIFTKEMPLVLKAVLHGDSMLFRENPELMNALVRVYFHSSSKIYNRMECWGPLKDAAEGRQEDSIQGLLTANKEGYHSPKKLARPKSIFQALFAFLL
ncbi:Magnesium dechelatase SGRL [Citrus sinensis]|uniref:Magnesium dechelatase SGRL n=1 Tax=Citrus sinensis TaxID=2711 RepID=A0ACB8KSF3_CITSI|nr:Magnesium dechelatase SGRL [Citrus sinensis]